MSKSVSVVPKAKVLGCEAEDFRALNVAITNAIQNYGVSLLAVTMP